MKYPLVRELSRDGIPVTVTCRVLKFSCQGYYRWLREPWSSRDYENAYLTNAAYDAHRDDPTFGYRFISDELEAAGLSVSERRVWRLCSQQAIWSSFVKKSRSGKKPGPPVHDDLVQREFESDDLDVVWFTDLTEHSTNEGKLYLCSLMDACSTRIVGYSIGDRMTADLAVSALSNAIALRDPAGTKVHSDRGSQYISGTYRDLCTDSSARWDESPPRPTTRPSSRSTHSCRRTFSTLDAGKRRRICDSPSSPGLKRNIIVSVANVDSGDLRRSSLRHYTKHQEQHETTNQKCQPNRQQSRITHSEIIKAKSNLIDFVVKAGPHLAETLLYNDDYWGFFDPRITWREEFPQAE